MELVAALFLLYGAQCWVRLPSGSTLFVRRLRRWRWFAGHRWALTHLVPSALAIVAARLPVIEVDGRLHGRGAGDGTALPPLEPHGEFTARGPWVRVDGRAFARVDGAEQAARLAARLREATAGDPRPVLEAMLVDSFRWTELQTRRDELQHHGRWLRRGSNAYGLVVFGVLPALVVLFGEESGLLLGLPAVVSLHVLVWAAFVVAWRRLGQGGAFEDALAMALYPPALLNGYRALARRLLGGFHPAAVAAVVLDGPPRDDFLRGELVRARASGASLSVLEARAVEGLLESLGCPIESLLEPPHRPEPLAAGYCPACREPYRRTHGNCADCGVPLASYPDPVPPG